MWRLAGGYRRWSGTRRRWSLVLAAVVMVLSGASPAMAAWESQDVAVPGEQYSGAIAVAYDATGRAYALYSRYEASAPRPVLRERPAGGVWGAAQPVPIGTFAVDARLDVNAAGDVVVAYGDPQMTVIRRPHGQGWQAPVTFDSPASAGPGCARNPALDQNDAGRIAIAWGVFDNCPFGADERRVMATTFDPASGWEPSAQSWDVSGVDLHGAPAVAIEDDGDVVVAFGAYPNADFVAYDGWVAERTAGVWGGPVVHSGATSSPSEARPPVVVARGDTVVLAWRGRTEGAFADVRTGGVWAGVQQLPVQGGWIDGRITAAVDASGTAQVALASTAALVPRTGLQIEVVTRAAGGGWTGEVVVPGSFDPEPSQPAVAVNANGDTVLAWTERNDLPGRHDLAVMLKPAGGAWPPAPTVVAGPSGSTGAVPPGAAVDVFGHGLAIGIMTTNGNGLAPDVILATETRDPAEASTVDPPVITPPTASVGTVLTCSPGTFAGTPPFTYGYTWLQDSAPIPGATGSTYTVQAGDAALGIGCRVSATNAAGTAEAYAEPVVVAATPPSNTVAPSVTGTMEVGDTVGCLPGSWSGAPAPEFTFAWRRDGVAIVGEVGDTYVVTTADGGRNLSCRVTAANVGGTVAASSAPRAVPTPLAPRVTVAPVLSGPAQAAIGDTLSCSLGTWAGRPAPTVTQEWRRGGVTIPGAYGGTYLVTAADAGSTITCVVTGSNVVADTSVVATGSRAVPPPPSSRVAPTVGPVTGATWAVGQVARCNPGTWVNALTFTYQWNRNNLPIAGATTQDRTITAADAGTNLSCTVTASGRGGTASATSAVRAVAPAPVATVAPTITGTARPGRALTCNRGTWTNASTFAFAWLRDGVVIASGSNRYTVVPADVGRRIQCRVTATGPGGSTVAVSLAVVPTP